MLTQLRMAFLLLLTLTGLTGVAYPLAITAVAQIAFSRQANGSLIVTNDQPVGSQLIGQSFDDAQYFWGRLSATRPVPYNAAASSGSNRGPRHPGLGASAQARIATLKRADPQNTQPIPVDLVTTSASGLDPHISVAAALYQIPRVARARGLPETRVRQLVAEFTEARQFGFLGEPRVNVLRLNLALDVIQ